MSSSPNRENDTVARRLQKYARFQKLDLYMGGGLGGLVLFGDPAKDAFADASDWVRTGFITSALITGLCIGFAYSGFQWAETELKRKCDDTGAADSSKIRDVAPKSWPARASWLQKLAPVLVGATAIWLLVAVWWPYPWVVRWVAPLIKWLRGDMDWILVALLVVNVALIVANVVLMASAGAATILVVPPTAAGANWQLFNVGTGTATDVQIFKDGTTPISIAAWPYFPPGEKPFVYATTPPGQITVRWKDKRPFLGERAITYP